MLLDEAYSKTGTRPLGGKLYGGVAITVQKQTHQQPEDMEGMRSVFLGKTLGEFVKKSR